MHKFKNLEVWKRAFDIAVDTYALTKKFPTEEKFGLISQVNRSAISISSNIAEGAGRNSTAEFRHFLSIATSSSYELETQLLVAAKLNYIRSDELNAQITNLGVIQKMLSRLILSIEQTSHPKKYTKH